MLKKTSFILILLVSSSLIAKAQSDTLVFYMKRNGLAEIPTIVKDSAEFYRMILPPENDNVIEDGISELFIVKDYYINKKPKMIGKTVYRSPNLKLEGPCIEFFMNGKKKSIRNFENNIPVGDVTRYFPNGKIYIIGSYVSNNKLIINECRDSTGKVIVNDGNGYCVEYSENFKNVTEEGPLLNGLKEGTWHGSLNDSIKYVFDYKNDVLQKGTSYDKNGKAYPFTTAQSDPGFKGGLGRFYKFLAQNIHYPQPAKDNNIQGKVFITFIVEKDGSITNIRILRSIGWGCDEEATRVIKSSPRWIPGIQYGLPVRVQYTLPISFSLTYKNVVSYH